jgi:hypothetical protein
MAKVWFVRREGARWVAPGGRPAFEAPLTQLIFPLDLGPQRLLVDGRPEPRADRPPEPPHQLTKVIVEVDPDDLNEEYTWFEVGFYDSPYTPRVAARRLAAVLQPRAA